MEQRVSIVTLGVADVPAARSFYERLGWHTDLEVEETIFFQAGGILVILWGRDKLAEDSGVADDGGWGGVTLAHNVGTTDEVDRVIEEARAAGARISREPAATFYGGYAGVFVDLDGHPWEIAHNPGLVLGDDGRLQLSVWSEAGNRINAPRHPRGEPARGTPIRGASRTRSRPP